MKTIEEKAKAYDDLLVKLQKAKVDNDACDERYCCVIDDIVPELKEVEDEKIRKELIKETKGSEVRLFEIVTNEEFIAWLERQGEQKSIEWSGKIGSKHAEGKLKEMLNRKENYVWSEEDEEMRLDAIKYLEIFDAQGIHGDRAIPAINWLKSLKDITEFINYMKGE